MQLEIARPWVFVLFPVLAGVIIWFARGFRSRRGSRRIGEICMRCLVLLCVILAFSGMSIKKSSDRTTTIFLVDLSDSMKGVYAEETKFVQSAIAEMPDKNQAGIVVFGADAQIEQFVSEKKVFTDFQSQVTATATNLEQAVQTSLALFPDESACRLVLLTDGSENEGSIQELASSFAGTDVELKVVSYDSSVEKEVYISEMTLPDTIHQGDRFQVKTTIYSTDTVKASVSLYSGRTLKDQKDVILQKGENQLVFSDQGVEGGLKSYRVTVEAEEDTVSVNNTYSAFTTVEARPKLLVVEGSKKESKEFVKVLEACNYDYEVVTPSGVPSQISDLTLYQSIILVDVYADDLRSGFLENLKTYVKDYAGGVAAIGGPNSFALGNYRNTPLEEILPVQMDLEGEKQIPKLAMVMVIDHSGSMSSPSTDKSGITCMDIAKQAAVNSLDSLREIDEVGVLAFDDGYTWSVPLQEAVDTGAIIERISGIGSAGGTSIYPALAEAVKKIKKSDAALKHIVLLTDGQDGFQAYEDVLKEMEEEGITLSTVAVGTGADNDTLQWLAQEGGGRYYYSDASTTLPRIFAQEVYLSVKSYLINEEFTPVIVNSHEIIQDIFNEGSPSLLGYIASTPKATASVLLQSSKEDPILTVWQYGLGRTVAWNSDVTGQWTGNFAGWDHYAALWRNIIDWTISKSELGEDTIQIQQEASSAVVTYETENYSAQTNISAVFTSESGEQQEVTLKAVSPGVYQSEVPLDEVGIYSINIRNQEGKEIVKNINTAAAMQYSQEYRYADVHNTLEKFVEKVSGRYITQSEEVFDTDLKGAMSRIDLTEFLLFFGILLFMADVIIRRMCVDWLGVLQSGWMRASQGIRQLFIGRVKQAERRNAAGGGRRSVVEAGQKSGQNGKADGSAAGNHAGVSGTGQSGKAGSAKATATAGSGTTISGTTTSGAAAADERPSKSAETQKTGFSRKKSAQKAKKQKTGTDSHNSRNADENIIDTSALLKKKRERDL